MVTSCSSVAETSVPSARMSPAATVTVNDLTDGATYTIVAAAMNDLGIVVSEPVTMTTTDVPAEPQVTITQVEATDASFTFVVTPTDATKCAYKLSAADQKQTQAVHTSVMNHSAALGLQKFCGIRQPLLVGRCQLIPDREVIGKVHSITILMLTV